MGAAAVWAGAEYAERFFMGVAEVQQAMRKLVERLDELGIPYAIVGAMALNEHGYRRVTVDVDVLLTREGLERFKDRWIGRGYVEKSPGSRGVRDTEFDVAIDVLLAGDFPGDMQPKPVRFPDPSMVAVRERGLALIPIANLVELKLAAGISAPQRMKDLGDVLELIKSAKLGRQLSEALDTYVRPKYLEFWEIAQTPDPMPE
jgi:hypothetical protein